MDLLKGNDIALKDAEREKLAADIAEFEKKKKIKKLKRTSTNERIQEAKKKRPKKLKKEEWNAR